jgi:hypothetical protein
MGFVPWAFHTAPADNSPAWAQLTDPQGFAAPYGPPTVERRSPWFMHDAYNGCCRWDGPSWPYATSQTLTGLANLLAEYPGQSSVTKNDYYTALRQYALTQYKDGTPHVAEAHDPDQPKWMYDSYNHSEDYNHSTYADLVLSGLLGIRPQQDSSVVLHPLVPDTWTHFAVENLAYHGHNLTVLWDRDGTHYRQGTGLTVYVDGKRVATRPDLTPVRIAVPDRTSPPPPRLVDDAANVSGNGYPAAIASYSNTEGAADDAPQKANDGQNFFLDIPTTRWTTYRSPNAEDWLAIDFGTVTSTSDVRLYFYDDHGGVQPPASYRLQYRRSNGTWTDVPGQSRSSATPVGNDLTRITFPPLRTTGLRVLGRPQPGSSFGLTAFQSWRSVS